MVEGTKHSMDLGVWGMTHTGQVRRENQDSFYAVELASPPANGSARLGSGSVVSPDDEFVLLPLGARGAVLLVADGMGGAAGGEVASRLAVNSVIEALERIWRGGAGATAEEFAERLKDSIIEANARIQAYARDRPWFDGMGTTLTAAAILGDSVLFAQVGDSRAYLLRGERLIQVTRDQTWVQDMVEVGSLTEDQARESPRRNLLVQALGTTSDLDIPISQSPFVPGDVLMLCSDGLSGVLDEEAVRDILIGSPSLRAACEKLIAETNEAGAPDNVTALLAEPRARCRRVIPR